MPKLTNEELQVIRERLKSFTAATRKEDEARKGETMDKQQITTWIEAAQQEVDRISREGTARRCIPVQPTDTDILLRDGAEMMAAALEHIEALEAELEAARDALVWITSLPLSQIQAIRCATH